MSTRTVQTRPALPHADGGTYRVIAEHAGVNGWAVDVIRRVVTDGRVRFVARRISPDRVAFPVSDPHRSEADAREAANREWMTQMGRLAEYNLSRGAKCGCGWIARTHDSPLCTTR